MVDRDYDTIESIDASISNIKFLIKRFERESLPKDIMDEQMRLFKEELGGLMLRRDKLNDASW